MARSKDAQTRTPRSGGRAASLTTDLAWLWPHAVSMGLCQGAMFVPFVLGPLGMGLGAVLWDLPQYTFCFFAAVALGMLANDLAASRSEDGSWGLLRFSAPVAAVFVVGGVLLTAHALRPSGALASLVGCTGAALMGCGTACAQLSSARFIAGLTARQGARLVLTAMPVSALLLVVASVLRVPAAGFAFAVLPVASCALMHYARAHPRPAQASVASSGVEVLGGFAAGGTWRAGAVTGCATALAAFVVFAARYVFVRLDVAPLAAPAGFSAAFIGALCALVALVVAVACFKTRTLSMTFVFRIALPAMVAGASLVGLLPQDATSTAGYWLAAFLAAAGMLVIDQMVWIITAYFMRGEPAICEHIVSRSRMLQFAGAALGAVLSVPSVIGVDVIQTMFVGTAALAVAFVVCIPTYEPRVVSVGAAAPRFDGLDHEQRDRYAVVFSRYGLTAREAEVACLVAEGLDAPGVAQRLCVSRATVNTHVRHIYEKLGVHARDEMLAVLGQVPRG